jgi:hypothetical protein
LHEEKKEQTRFFDTETIFLPIFGAPFCFRLLFFVEREILQSQRKRLRNFSREEIDNCLEGHNLRVRKQIFKDETFDEKIFRFLVNPIFKNELKFGGKTLQQYFYDKTDWNDFPQEKGYRHIYEKSSQLKNLDFFAGFLVNEKNNLKIFLNENNVDCADLLSSR